MHIHLNMLSQKYVYDKNKENILVPDVNFKNHQNKIMNYHNIHFKRF